MILFQDVVEAIKIELAEMDGNTLAALHNKLNPTNPLKYVTGGQFARVDKNPYTPKSDD